MRAAQAEVGRVRDQLAFYEQLLPPGPEARSIYAARRSSARRGLRYKVLLMRSGRNGGAPFSCAALQAVGTLGETVTVELAPMQVKSEATPAPDGVAAGLALQFDQYQRSQGMLALPEGFVPESVTITVLEAIRARPAASSSNFESGPGLRYSDSMSGDAAPKFGLNGQE